MSKSVLIVGEEEELPDNFLSMLSKNGYSTQTVRTMQEARSAIIGYSPLVRTTLKLGEQWVPLRQIVDETSQRIFLWSGEQMVEMVRTGKEPVHNYYTLQELLELL